MRARAGRHCPRAFRPSRKESPDFPHCGASSGPYPAADSGQLKSSRFSNAIFGGERLFRSNTTANLAALFLWHLSAFLSRFGQSNCNGLLSTCYLAALSPFARAKTSFFLSTHGACNSLTRSLTIFSVRFLTRRRFCRHSTLRWWHLVLGGYIKLGSIF